MSEAMPQPAAAATKLAPPDLTHTKLPSERSVASEGFQLGEPPSETDGEAIARVAKLPLLEYERVRVSEAEKLGCRTSILDRLVQQEREQTSDGAPNRVAALEDAAPWPQTVVLADLLDAIAAAIVRHVVVSQAAADALALWAGHTWVYHRFDHTPRLAITSPTRRCGKSTLMELLRVLCRRTLKADGISTAGVYRTVEKLRPLTLLIDEADSFLRDNEGLRGVLNSGFERTGQVIRILEFQGTHEPVAFPTFAPVALAAIGGLPGTLADRAIPVRMVRKTPAETVERLRSGNNRAVLDDFARKLARWAADGAAALSGDPDVPLAFNDREADMAVPLLAIADSAGPAWGNRARSALLTLFHDRGSDQSTESGTQLLADIRLIFLAQCARQIPSANLCQHLGAMEDRPWPEWRHGKAMTQTQLARALKPFGLVPIKLRIGSVTVNGYRSEQFVEAWSRYLGDSGIAESAPDRVLEPEHRNKPTASAGKVKFPPGTSEGVFRLREPREPALKAVGSGVPVRNTFDAANSHDPVDEVVA